MKGLLRPGKAGTGSAVPKVDYRGDPYKLPESAPEVPVVAFGDIGEGKWPINTFSARGIPAFRRMNASSSDLEVMLVDAEGNIDTKDWADYAEELGLSAEEKERTRAGAWDKLDPIPTEIEDEPWRLIAWCRCAFYPATVLHFFNSEGKACLRLAGNRRAKLHVRDGWESVIFTWGSSFSWEVVENEGTLPVVGHNLLQVWVDRPSDVGLLDDRTLGSVVGPEERSDWWNAPEDGGATHPVPWPSERRGVPDIIEWYSGTSSIAVQYPVVPAGLNAAYRELMEVGRGLKAAWYGDVVEQGYAEARDVAKMPEELRAKAWEWLDTQYFADELKAWLPDQEKWKNNFLRPGIYRTNDADRKLVAILLGSYNGGGCYDGDSGVQQLSAWENKGTPWTDSGSFAWYMGDAQEGMDKWNKAGSAEDWASHVHRLRGMYREKVEFKRGEDVPKIRVRVTLSIGQWPVPVVASGTAGMPGQYWIPVSANLKGNVAPRGGEEDEQYLKMAYDEDNNYYSVVPADKILKTYEDKDYGKCYVPFQKVVRDFWVDIDTSSSEFMFQARDALNTAVWCGYEFGDWTK